MSKGASYPMFLVAIHIFCSWRNKHQLKCTQGWAIMWVFRDTASHCFWKLFLLNLKFLSLDNFSSKVYNPFQWPDPCLGFHVSKREGCERHCSINNLTIISQSIGIRHRINRWHNIFKSSKKPATICVAAQHHLLTR